MSAELGYSFRDEEGRKLPLAGFLEDEEDFEMSEVRSTLSKLVDLVLSCKILIVQQLACPGTKE